MNDGEYPDYGGTYVYAPDSTIDATLGTDW
jgi:hypothetical protein